MPTESQIAQKIQINPKVKNAETQKIFDVDPMDVKKWGMDRATEIAIQKSKGYAQNLGAIEQTTK